MRSIGSLVGSNYRFGSSAFNQNKPSDDYHGYRTQLHFSPNSLIESATTPDPTMNSTRSPKTYHFGEVRTQNVRNK